MSDYTATFMVQTSSGNLFDVDALIAEATLSGAEIVTAINAALGGTTWQTGGTAGPAVLHGTVDPTTQGSDDDFYINTTSWMIFGPKTGGAWGSGTALRGVDGVDGINGTNGTNGANGTNGVGVPAGGAAGQVLAKVNGTNYNTGWVTLTVSKITDLIDTDYYIGTSKGIRPGLDDDLAPAGSGYLFESVNDGHAYWVHRDGTVHLLCDGGTYGGGSGGSGGPSAGFATGVYQSAYNGQPSNANIVSDVMYYVPIYIPHSVVLSEIGVTVAASFASSSVRLGVFAAGNGTPGALILDAGSVTTSVTGARPISIGLALTAGWYYLALIGNSGGVQLIHDNVGVRSPLGLKDHDSYGMMFFRKSRTYGALPSNASFSDPVNTQAPLLSSDLAPRIWVRI